LIVDTATFLLKQIKTRWIVVVDFPGSAAKSGKHPGENNDTAVVILSGKRILWEYHSGGF
jgi:hypothetical protein